MLRKDLRRLLTCLSAAVSVLVGLDASAQHISPRKAEPASIDSRAPAGPGLQRLTDPEAPAAEKLPAAPTSEMPVEIRQRGSGLMPDAPHQRVERPVPPTIKQSAPREGSPQVNPAGLFGIGATPMAPPKNVPAREPEFYFAERADTAATREATSAGGKTYGEESVIRLDSALPVMQAVVGWTRSHRETVLGIALTVLVLTWAVGRQSSRKLPVSIGKPAEPPRRHRRRRRSSHHHSEASHGSSSSSRRVAEPWAPVGAGRSSGRHK
jgi:hypothetical protein